MMRRALILVGRCVNPHFAKKERNLVRKGDGRRIQTTQRRTEALGWTPRAFTTNIGGGRERTQLAEVFLIRLAVRPSDRDLHKKRAATQHWSKSAVSARRLYSFFPPFQVECFRCQLN